MRGGGVICRAYINYNYYLCHHGIERARWGVRRYQYNDGSYTSVDYALRKDIYYR